MNYLDTLSYIGHKVKQHGILHCVRKFFQPNNPLYKYTINSANLQYGHGHKPSPSELVQQSIGLLSVNYSEYSFVDIGCGTGTVLSAALPFNFKRVVGIEFAKELAEQAQKNVPAAEIYPGDATEYDYPEDNLIIYMYNPFDNDVMGKLMPKIKGADYTAIMPRYRFKIRR